MAFVSSLTTSSFAGTNVAHKSAVSTLNPERRDASGITMKSTYGLGKTLSLYINASRRIPTAQTGSTSKVWIKYQNMVNSSMFDINVTYESMMEEIRNMSRSNPLQNRSPEVTTADAYMSASIMRQYKAVACPNGVYTVACTEGNAALQADESRVAALGAAFRRKQRPASVKFGDKFDARRRAVAASHQCSYEENLFCKLTATPSMSVAASAEAIGACSRLAVSDNPVEQYMMDSVTRQCKNAVVPFGEYGVSCADGTTKGGAEFRRVADLAAKYRTGTWSSLAKEQRKYDVRKHARDAYGHGCTYEDALFTEYPEMAASMSGQGARY